MLQLCPGGPGTLHCNGRLGELAVYLDFWGLAKIGIGGFLSSFLLSYLTPHLHALYSQSSPIGRLQQRARQRQVQAFYLPTYLPCLDLPYHSGGQSRPCLLSH